MSNYSYLDSTGLTYLIGKIKTSFISTTDTTTVTTISIDSSPTNNSSNLITSGGAYTALSSKQDKLTISSNTHNGVWMSNAGYYYIVNNEVNTITFVLFQNSQATGIQEIVWNFTTGTTPNVTFNAGSGGNVYVAYGFEIEASSIYEVNALWNGTNWYVAGIKLINTASV